MAVTFPPLELTHFSYDSPWNPFFGGGGAQRDWEILKRLPSDWTTTYAVGGFDGCETVEAPAVWLGRGAGRWSSRVSYARAASAYARANPPRDGIWSISPSVFAPVPAYLAHPERTAISLFHLVGWNAWRKYGPLGLMAVWHERAILRRGRHFLCINGTTARQVAAARPDAHIELVPTGFTPLAEFPASGETPSLLFVGRLDLYMKGLDRLVETFSILASTRPDLRLTLAGRADAPSLRKLRALVDSCPHRDRIEIASNVDDATKAELMRSATVFCSPSRYEGWCIAAVEAQSCGVPVVASTADGFLDSVDDGASGILVGNDEDGFATRCASVVGRVLDDADLARRLGEGGRAKAASLTWDAVARRHAEVFRDIRERAA